MVIKIFTKIVKAKNVNPETKYVIKEAIDANKKLKSNDFILPNFGLSII